MMMVLSIYSVLESVLILTLSVLFCEYGYYYLIFNFNCEGWPGPSSNDAHQANLTKILVVADTHIMGPIKSVKLDKWRREWQMKQAFSISNQIYQPDLVMFLGDIFDEASFSTDEVFEKNCDDFDRIFPTDNHQPKRIIIAGNHDVGFHNQMIRFPYLLYRFQQKFNAEATVRLTEFNDVTIISSNSMAFYNDSCQICTETMSETNKISKYLEHKRRTQGNDYSSPILLIHIPLYRQNDTLCDYPIASEETVKKDNIEGKDVLHVDPSNFLLDKLKPRLILSGHTHMDCKTTHGTFEELTLSSYNHKYAEKRPSFLLMTVNSKEIYTRHCHLVHEWVIVLIYTATVVIIVSKLVIRR